MNFSYVIKHYSVPACFGRIITHKGNKGIITEDRGHYLGVNFDSDKPGVICNVHPTDEVEYLGIGVVRSLTRSQLRYKRFLDYGECFENFIDYCRWDSDPDRSWNP